MHRHGFCAIKHFPDFLGGAANDIAIDQIGNPIIRRAADTHPQQKAANKKARGNCFTA